MSVEDIKDEYKDLSENMRLYVHLRFAQMTLFVALTAGILNVLFTPNPKLSLLARFALKGLGLVVSICFTVMEARAADYWHHYRNRAIELEAQLNYKQFSSRPARKLISASNATKLLYGTIIAFWVVSIVFYTKF